MNKPSPVPVGERGWSIRWKLASAFFAIAIFVAGFVAVAITIQIGSLEKAAQLEAIHVAEVIAQTVKYRHASRIPLQDYISNLNAMRTRDFAIVDSDQMEVADANPQEVGTKYSKDLDDEIGKTIQDGRTRTFVEHSALSELGSLQLVMRIQDSDETIGAVVVEYTQIREELFSGVKAHLYVLSGSGMAALLLIVLFGLDVAKRVARPLEDLKDSVVRITRRDYTARVVTTSRDEIGRLGIAFNQMAEELAERAELIAFNNELEQEVARRKSELSESVTASIKMMQDVERQREVIERAHTKINYLASFDPVTGLAKQPLFQERLQQRLRIGEDALQKAAVIALGIERLDAVTQAFGSTAVDELLGQVAERMVYAGGGDASRFARIGPGRFAIAVADVGSAEEIGLYVKQKLDATFRLPFAVGGSEFRVSAKLGIAVSPDDGVDAETLLGNAQAALKKAKTSGQTFLFFTQAMTERVTERISLETRLRNALENEEFVLHYQPKFTLAHRELVGAEALLRWNDPTLGLVPPAAFIPILEETGMIHEVGRWVLREAMHDYARWRNEGLAQVRIAVNVSPLQLRDVELINDIRNALGLDGVAARGLELEITESLIMDNVEHNVGVLHAIRQLGVTISIDDFGTGYSSLSYLSKLPVDVLKIDRSFVNDMTSTVDGKALVSTIITLAHSLDLRVIAEGVETDEQAALLTLLGCDEGQGYLFSKPLPKDQFELRFLSLLGEPA